MAAHNGLDGFRCLVGVVEWNGANVVVENVSFDNTVKEMAADETEFAIDGCSGSSNIIPGLAIIMRKTGISVLKVSDGHYYLLVRVRE